MAGKSLKTSKKLTITDKDNEKQNKITIDEHHTLLEIKKELNTSLKDLFEDYDMRISKLENLLFDKDENTTIEKLKTPEHCYN